MVKVILSGYRFSRDGGVNWTEYQEETSYTFEEIYGDLAGVTCNVMVECKDRAENTLQKSGVTKTTCLNKSYYVTSANYTFGTCNGYTYKTISALGCFPYWEYYWATSINPNRVVLDGIIISSTSEGARLQRSDGEKPQVGPFTYHGSTYYWSHAWANSANPSATLSKPANIPLLGTSSAPMKDYVNTALNLYYK